MIRTLTGKNSYALQVYLQTRVAAVLASSGELAIERIDAQEASVDTILQAVQSLPFLVSEKLVIVTSLQSNTALMERLDELVDRTADSVEVLLVEPLLDKRKASFKQLKARTELHDFTEPQPRELPSWLVSEAKQLDATISMTDAQYLVDRVGAHQQLLAHELEKLSLYQPHITRQTIELLTDQSLQSTIFTLLDTAFSGNAKKTIELYHEQRRARIEPQYIIAMLVWQLQALAMAVHVPGQSEGGLVQAGMSPYTARKVLQLAHGKSRADIKKMVVDLTELDAAIKTNTDADAGLELYLLTLGEKS